MALGRLGAALLTIVLVLLAGNQDGALQVASGTHTQAEADQRLADATEHITAMVNGEKPAGGPGQDGQAPPADAPADGSTTTTAN